MRIFLKDLNASIIVFLLALPLCLGIALASNAPLLSGLIAGIVGGMVVAPLTGCQLSVSGPAAGLVVIVIYALEVLGSYEAFALAVVIAGVFQIILSLLKAGYLGTLFPMAVIKGMLAAIGIIMILKQITHILGVGGNLESLLVSTAEFQFGSLSVGIVSFFALLVWWAKKPPGSTFPMALVVVVTATVLSKLLGLFEQSLVIEGSYLVQLPRIEFSELSSALIFPDFAYLGNIDVYRQAGVIALVASIEMFLGIDAIDKLDPQKRTSDFNKELRVQGIGNICSGFIGGLPLTAVIARGSANVTSGAETRMSSFLHGFLLLLSVLALTPIMNQIPLSVLAAILIVVGMKLNKFSLYKEMWGHGREHFLPFVATILFTVTLDLLSGVTLGILVASIFIVRRKLRS